MTPNDWQVLAVRGLMLGARTKRQCLALYRSMPGKRRVSPVHHERIVRELRRHMSEVREIRDLRAARKHRDIVEPMHVRWSRDRELLAFIEAMCPEA